MHSILAVDDSPSMRQMVSFTLKNAGFNVVEAVDGQDAWEKAGGRSFDLVLTDWNMPGKSGLEVVQAIRAQDAKVPIIMVTTEAEKARVMQAIEAGVSDYLVKPFTAETLREKLEKHGC